MGFISFCNKTLAFAFYSLFFLVPLSFTNNTSELFELNKMWLTWGITIVIAVLWFLKMTFEKRIFIQKTVLDIPIILFLISQIISTIFSMDPHISLWGYYSRFNGGLLSLLSYAFLYYAFVSNFGKKQTIRALFVTLISGTIVALWGLPSHFGADPTCLLFRGSLDTNCWTDAFKPTIRIFSTLGQPAWLAAYLCLLIPLSLAFFLRSSEETGTHKQKNHESQTHLQFLLKKPFAISYMLLAILFYADLIFTDTRAGVIAFWIGYIFFWTLPGFVSLSRMKKLIQIACFFTGALLITYFFSKTQYLLFWLIPIAGYFFIRIFFNRTYMQSLIATTLVLFFITVLSGSQTSGLSDLFHHQAPAPKTSSSPAPAGGSSLETGGTDSGKIRSFVWKGAIDVWKANPFFGTGVETFAFAYYKFRPAGHNLTSEWDYLYNKAHNEYLNYLATTGIVGLGTYLLMIAVFLFFALSSVLKTSFTTYEANDRNTFLLVSGLITGYSTILITNFFGFSVVIMNIYLFLIPAFVFFLTDQIQPEKAYVFRFGNQKSQTISANPYQWTLIILFLIIGTYLLLQLILFWIADTEYALGHNYDDAGVYQQAYQSLNQAVQTRGEPVFKDEFAINNSALAVAFAQQKNTSAAAQLAQNAVNLSNQVLTDEPNNVVFWKDRVRIFYTLSLINQQYLATALTTMEDVQQLAPTDAKVRYQLGVLYGQLGQVDRGIHVLQDTIVLKPDYLDAYYALAVFYHEQAVDKNNKVVKPELQQKAIDELQYALIHIAPDDSRTKKTLDSWKKEQ